MFTKKDLNYVIDIKTRDKLWGISEDIFDKYGLNIDEINPQYLATIRHRLFGLLICQDFLLSNKSKMLKSDNVPIVIEIPAPHDIEYVSIVRINGTVHAEHIERII